jgi:Transposase and inactivated derivatives
MGKVTTKAVFKEYNQNQIQLLPPSLEDLIPENDLVRVVNQVVEKVDLSSLINQYEGGGASAYHPKMLTKVLLYGYSMKIYTGRKIARALRQDIHFMWLAAYQRPDFRTINLFRSGILKETIEELFKQARHISEKHSQMAVRASCTLRPGQS